MNKSYIIATLPSAFTYIESHRMSSSLHLVELDLVNDSLFSSLLVYMARARFWMQYLGEGIDVVRLSN